MNVKFNPHGLFLVVPGSRSLEQMATAPEGFEGVVRFDDQVIVVLDKYAKAKHHFLVVSRDRSLEDLTCLRPEHCPMLHHMILKVTANTAGIICTIACAHIRYDYIVTSSSDVVPCRLAAMQYHQKYVPAGQRFAVHVGRCASANVFFILLFVQHRTDHSVHC